MFFQNIKVLIWDFDGTLFRSNEALFQAVREAEYRVIMSHTHWDREKTKAEFSKKYKVVSPSGTTVTAMLANIATRQASHETEKYFNRSDYLSLDAKLVALFQVFLGYRHVLLTNGIETHIRSTIQTLGFATSPFEHIITPETTGVTKPDLKAFSAVLNYTKLPANQHLMVGDRELVDLAPAKQLGMKTCLVWSEKKSDIADVTLPDVYSLASLLTNSRKHVTR